MKTQQKKFRKAKKRSAGYAGRVLRGVVRQRPNKVRSSTAANSAARDEFIERFENGESVAELIDFSRGRRVKIA